MADKPGITTLAQLAEVRRVQAETRRIYSIMYSERFENRATVKAAELVKAGAIGRVVQTIGLGPHRTNAERRGRRGSSTRRSSAASSATSASHQADQFLHFTGSTRAEVVASQVGNVHHPQYPAFEDFGDVVLRGDAGTGYIRVDWFTPDGLATWGDGRLTILGTDGFIEIRKNVDIAGRPGRKPSVSRRSERDALHRLQGRRAAVRRRARRRRRQSHGDGDVAGALLPGDRADAQGAGTRRSGSTFIEIAMRTADRPRHHIATDRRVAIPAAPRCCRRRPSRPAFRRSCRPRCSAQTAPSNRINVGAIGTGRISRGHDLPGIWQHDTRTDRRGLRCRQPARGRRQDAGQRATTPRRPASPTTA